MMTYVIATSIIGGRLSPGILLGHMATMGKVLEALATKPDVAFKAAFLVILVLPFSVSRAFLFRLCV